MESRFFDILHIVLILFLSLIGNRLKGIIRNGIYLSLFTIFNVLLTWMML